MKIQRRWLLPILPLLVGAAQQTIAGEQEILADIKAFFAEQSLDAREATARRIEADPDYDRARVAEWLNRAELFETLAAGQQRLDVPLDLGRTRSVALRIPRDYDAARPWPLIYALHGTGGSGDGIIRLLEATLGDDVERYVIAAPSNYDQAVIHSRGEASREHPLVLHSLSRKVHVNSDRVYVLGYSMGGHATWTLAVLHADEFAAAIPMAGTFILPDPEELWPPFLPNLAHLHVLNVWGAQDVYGPDGRTLSPDGGIAGMNRKLQAAAAERSLDIVSIEQPETGHSDVRPPTEALKEALHRERVHYPKAVEHAFRYTYQGSAYWLEARAWTGPQWEGPEINVTLRADDDPNDPEAALKALHRAIRVRLGGLSGKVDGQHLDVRRKHVKELVIWVGDGLVDWEKPVKVDVSARPVFEGMLKPDLFVCLSQAARTYDLQRLRWAGLKFTAGRKVEPVTGRTVFEALGK